MPRMQELFCFSDKNLFVYSWQYNFKMNSKTSGFPCLVKDWKSYFSIIHHPSSIIHHPPSTIYYLSVYDLLIKTYSSIFSSASLDSSAAGSFGFKNEKLTFPYFLVSIILGCCSFVRL